MADSIICCSAGHVNTEQVVVDASTADPYNVALIALGSGEHDDSHGMIFSHHILLLLSLVPLENSVPLS